MMGKPAPEAGRITHQGDAMNATAPTAFGTLVNIFLEPKKALTDIRGHNGWGWLPFLLLIVLGVAFQLWYLSSVDHDWFVDQLLAPKAATLTADQLRDQRARMTPGSMQVFTVIFSVLIPTVWLLLQTLYFFMLAKLGGYKEQGFGSWFSFVAWTSMPALLGFLASGVFLATATGRQISPVDIDVTSLNTLLFHVPFGNKWQTLLASIRLTSLWGIVLSVIGFSIWTGKSTKQSVGPVLTLYAGAFAIWAIIVAL